MAKKEYNFYEIFQLGLLVNRKGEAYRDIAGVSRAIRLGGIPYRKVPGKGNRQTVYSVRLSDIEKFNKKQMKGRR